MLNYRLFVFSLKQMHLVKAKFHYAIQVADLVCGLVAELLARF